MQTAYQQGYDACLDGKPFESPFLEASQLTAEWKRGYADCEKAMQDCNSL